MNEIVQVRVNSWASIVSAQKASGLTIKQWCAQNNLSEHSYYYRLRQLRRMALNEVDASESVNSFASSPAARFVKVPESAAAVSNEPVLRIQKGDTRIEVNQDVPDRILMFLKEVLLHAE